MDNMEVNEFTVENYNFKKAMQRNIIKNMQPLLLENKFTKYKNNRYVRERDGLAQLISFKVSQIRVEARATYTPMFMPWDDVLTYGIEVTGTSGIYLLDGKYSGFVSNQKDGFDNQIQLQYYYEELVPRLNKLFLAIKEGVLPEMDQMNSFECFVGELEKPYVSFFNYKVDTRPKERGTPLRLFVAMNKLLKGEFLEGIGDLKDIIEFYQINGYHRDDILALSEKLLNSIGDDVSLGESNVRACIDSVCNEMRRYYKLIK